jgi:serine protease Do
MQPKFLKLALVGLIITGIMVPLYVQFPNAFTQPDSHQENLPAAPGAESQAKHHGHQDHQPESLRGLPNFADIAAESGPAVVNISAGDKVKTNTKERRKKARPGTGDPFAPFFGPQTPPENEKPAGGMGSGFIIDTDGLILTNAHVIEGATVLTVKLADRREFVATLVGMDKLTDTAVLRIDAHHLPAVRIGDPGKSRVGDWALAIGSPFGFENTVTAGIISAKSRSLPEEGYIPFIQSDVALNPGNSGGPLLNTQGEVIGINSQIYCRSGGYQGLSFAIPIDVALNVEEQLIQTGRVSRGRLGIGVQELTQALAESFGLDKPDGALVGMVPPDGPGDKAGLKAGDVILALNGHPVVDSRELPPRVAALKPGADALLTIWRDRQKMEILLEVAELDEKAAPPTAPVQEKATETRLGISGRPLTAAERRSRHLQSGGILVQKVMGPAAVAGIRPGDIVLSVSGKSDSIETLEQLQELSRSAGHHIALLILRGEGTQFIPVPLD